MNVFRGLTIEIPVLLLLAGCFVQPGMQGESTPSSSAPALSSVYNMGGNSYIQVNQTCNDASGFKYIYSSSLTSAQTATAVCSGGNASVILPVSSGGTPQTFQIAVYTRLRNTYSSSPTILTWYYNPGGGVPDHLVVIGGDGQSATVNTNVPINPTVQVADSSGRGVSGVSITFAVTNGSGSPGDTTVTTDSNGYATTTYTLGTVAGTASDVLSATPTTVFLPGSPSIVTFTENAQAAGADHLFLIDGNGQTYPRGNAVPINPEVEVVDVFGNPVQGVGVTFTVTGGGGSVGGSPVVSDVNGNASTSFTLGAVAGVNTMTAAGQSALPGTPSTILFTETGSNTGTIADHVVYVTGDGQTGSVNTALTISPEVQVVDAGGLPVPGVSMQFTVLTGGGLVNGAASTVVVSDPSGFVTATYSLGAAAGGGNNTMTVGRAVSLLPGAPSTYTFTESATLTGTIPDHLVYVNGNGQSGTVGQVLPIPLQIQVVDAGGLPVPGVSLKFAVKTGGGSVGGATTQTVVSDGSGNAQVSLMLGTKPGVSNNSIQVGRLIPVLPGAPPTYTFLESASVGSPTQLKIVNFSSEQTMNACGGLNVHSEDAYGNASNVAVLTQVNLSYSGTTGTGAFYTSLANCNSNTAPVISKNINAGASSTAIIYFKYNNVDTITVSGADNAGLLSPGAENPVYEGTQDALTGPASGNVGTCMGPYTITSEDGLNNPVNLTAADTVTLGGNSDGIAFSDSACTQALGSPTMSAGTNSIIGIYFRDYKSETIAPFSSHSSKLVTDNFTLSITTNALGPSSIIVTGPSFITKNTCTPYTVVPVDTYGNIASLLSATPMNISSTLAGQVWRNAGCTIAGPISVIGTSGTVYLIDAAVEEPQITVDASGAGLGTATFLSNSQNVIAGTTAVVSGIGHLCTLNSSGAVKCVGADMYSQMGNGTTQNSVSAPVQVTGLSSGVTAIAAGSNHTCAIVGGGAVECWGYNNYGQLGSGDNHSYTTPVTVPGLVGATAIAAGASHTCVITASSNVECWGYNSAGQLGNNTTTNSFTPVTVLDPTGASNLTGVTAIIATSSSNCAIAAGAVYCWGNNYAGELGNGSNTNSSISVQVSGLAAGASKIAGGLNTACVLMASGAAKCWGYGNMGRLGNSAGANSNVPVGVTGIGAGSGMTNIMLNNYAGCVVSGAGALSCWGGNTEGQVGDGTTTNRTSPVASGVGVSSFSSSPAGNSTCVIESGNVFCTGRGDYFENGNGILMNNLSLGATLSWN